MDLSNLTPALDEALAQLESQRAESAAALAIAQHEATRAEQEFYVNESSENWSAVEAARSTRARCELSLANLTRRIAEQSKRRDEERAVVIDRLRKELDAASDAASLNARLAPIAAEIVTHNRAIDALRERAVAEGAELLPIHVRAKDCAKELGDLTWGGWLEVYERPAVERRLADLVTVATKEADGYVRHPEYGWVRRRT